MAYASWGAVAERAAGSVVTAPSIVPAFTASRSAGLAAPTQPWRPPRSACPELDCVRHLIEPGVLLQAERRAARIGVGADRVLITAGVIDEERYVTLLAAFLGMPFEPLGPMRGHCPLSAANLVEAANTGMLPLIDGDDMPIVVAPTRVDSRRLVSLAMVGADPVWRVRLTTAARLQSYAARRAAQHIAQQAADRLRDAEPAFSDAGRSGRLLIPFSLAVTAMATVIFPSLFLPAIEFALGVVFMAWSGLRLLGLCSERLLDRRPRSFADDWLPIYSIVVALYREGKAVGRLVEALRALDYPHEKLDVKLVLEPDDDETREALESLRLGPPFDVIIAPDRGPRTKPKALNAALPWVRGKFVVIYDAEDLPEPDQLRLALEAFVAGDERLACVQARLTVDNTTDSWLTRLFTAEYAGLFDVFLPGLAVWGMPLPLGGSSNHFRTEVLRQIGAWDPYNVTEDADLGLRLARFGYRSTVIASTTYEEAPSHFAGWLRQRSRWFKGWMQTWLVHIREPSRLRRELGWTGFTVVQLLVGGSVLAALVHCLFAAWLGWRAATLSAADVSSRFWIGFDFIALLSGYGLSAALGTIGLVRRQLLGCGWALLLTPFYWLLLSVAAWRALFQLLRDPYRWEKTDHGLARSSRWLTDTA